MNLQIEPNPIDLNAFRSGLEDVRCGAAVFFEGRVRDHNEGRAVLRLEYEAYVPLALSEGARIIREAHDQWGIERAHCIHRSGVLELGEVAVIVGVVSPHRDDAFQAARYVIDEVKHRLPIWKKEYYADGESGWINCQRSGKILERPEPAVSR